MMRRRRAPGSVSTNVFVNMPFESGGKYRDLLVAYVAGLAGLGFTARTVLEIPQHDYRLSRLRKIIDASGSSIHDLSCVAATAGCPRFNMPFELGLVVARPRSKWFVFEEKAYRLQRTLSDLNGHDPLVHGGRARGAIAGLASIFENASRSTTVSELLVLHRDVAKLARVIERDHGSLIDRRAFVDLVVGAQKLARKHGLI